MRLLIQRVLEASVTIDGVQTAHIGQGLLLFVGIEAADTAADIDFLTSKTAALRIFDDADGVMNRSVVDVGGELLVVSQFTLYASTRKGNRPSYIHAAKPDISVPLYEAFCQAMSQKLGRDVATGQFGADMKVALTNDGPVTIWIDSKHSDY